MREHRVACAVCGKRGRVRISEKGMILSRSFFYYGKIDLSHQRTSKAFFEVLFDENGHILFDENGHMETKRIRNRNYDPNARHVYVEYFECNGCHDEEADNGDAGRY